jgi:16S rRNA (guanine966-N2)-methyltransferase
MKLRIISGGLKHRVIEVPKKFSAHPMGERIRAALFNSLAGDIQGAKVLDAFGGSGACGLEALSRGAGNVLILEKERSVFRYLNKNVKSLHLEDDPRLHISKAPALNYLKSNPKLTFDIIICDPPYEIAEKMKPEDDNQLFQTLREVATRLNKNGIIILSWPEKTDLPEIPNLYLKKEKAYAGAKLAWYEQ